jgi:hypothetical protein
MEKHYFSKADPIISNEPVKSVQINISKAIPEMRKYPLDKCERFHARQAKRIAKLLYNSLPQGTFDRIIYEMMGIKFKKYPSVYRGKTNS